MKKIFLILVSALLGACILLGDITSRPNDKTRVIEADYEKYIEEHGGVEGSIKNDILTIRYEDPVLPDEYATLIFKEYILIMPIVTFNNSSGIYYRNTGKVNEISVNINTIQNIDDFERKLCLVVDINWGMADGVPNRMRCIKFNISTTQLH